MSASRIAVVLVVGVVAIAAAARPGPLGSAMTVTVTPNESAKRVDVAVGGKPFTSYIWPDEVKKPVLDPIRSAGGTLVTRGWPRAPRPGERVDHPHHVGLWFNYESVNGLDFWNNSDAIKPEQRSKMGTILHRRISSATGGADHGELVTESDWVTASGKVLLRERTQFVFAGDATTRTIDRIATLTAAEERVVFAAGRATPVPVLDNTGVTGEYLSSEGKKGDAVWSTRGRWTILTGSIGTQPITIAMIDHPKNPGFPTYWHARGYGLFAANPLGQKVFSGGKETLNFTLEPGASATFRYRVMVVDGKAPADRIEREYAAFAR